MISDEAGKASIPVKKRLDWFKISVAAIVLILIAAILITYLFPKSSGIAASGDTVKISYSLEISDGTKISNVTEGVLGDISPALGFQSDELDKALAGMKAGEEKTIQLSAADAFGEYSDEFISVVNRTTSLERRQEKNRTFEFPSQYFEQQFGSAAELNKVYEIENVPWKFKVLEMTNDTVTISQELTQGDTIPGTSFFYPPFGNVTSVYVEKVTAEQVTFVYNLKNGTNEFEVENDITVTLTSDNNYLYFKTTPKVGKKVQQMFGYATVLDVNDTSIVYDYNLDYAGMNVTVKIKVLDVKKAATGNVDSSTCYGKYGAKSDDIVFAYATWCPHCEKMQPIVKELQSEGYSFFWSEEKNDSFKMITECFKGFEGFPTFFCARSGEKVSGEMSKAALKEFADKCKSSSTDSNTQSNVPKSDKPLVELFVWAFCPGAVYGENVVKPVADLLKEKIDVKVRFIGPVTTDKARAASGCFAGRGKSTDEAVSECCITYDYNSKTYYSCALHNSKTNHLESIESERQACILEKYGSAKLLQYTAEFNAKCISQKADETAFNACWKTALEKIGTVADIESCISSKEGLKLLIEDNDYGESLGGISVSPSFYVNGNQVEPSNSDSLKGIICSAFNTQPSECSGSVEEITTQSSGGCGA